MFPEERVKFVMGYERLWADYGAYYINSFALTSYMPSYNSLCILSTTGSPILLVLRPTYHFPSVVFPDLGP